MAGRERARPSSRRPTPRSLSQGFTHNGTALISTSSANAEEKRWPIFTSEDAACAALEALRTEPPAPPPAPDVTLGDLFAPADAVKAA